MTETQRLRAALEQWKCPACGGSGNYLNKSNATGAYEETTVPCTKCAGHGLHPIAIDALRDNPTVPEVCASSVLYQAHISAADAL